MPKPVLFALYGLPRSGKSTVCAKLHREFGAPIVRRDAIRLALHGQRYQPEAEEMVKALSHYMMKSLFLAGHDFVICDETNFSRAARQGMYSKNWDTVWYPIYTPPEICIERAHATGQPDLEAVINSMWERREPNPLFEATLFHDWIVNSGHQLREKL